MADYRKIEAAFQERGKSKRVLPKKKALLTSCQTRCSDKAPDRRLEPRS
jgi:hypothetical protein